LFFFFFFRMAVIFVGSARPFAFKEMVRKDTGSPGGSACTIGIKRKEKRRKKYTAVESRGKEMKGSEEVNNPRVWTMSAAHVILRFGLHVLEA